MYVTGFTSQPLESWTAPAGEHMGFLSLFPLRETMVVGTRARLCSADAEDVASLCEKRDLTRMSALHDNWHQDGF